MHLDHGVELLGLSQPHPFAHIHGTHHGKSNISTSLKPTLVIVFAVLLQAYWLQCMAGNLHEHTINF